MALVKVVGVKQVCQLINELVSTYKRWTFVPAAAGGSNYCSGSVVAIVSPDDELILSVINYSNKDEPCSQVSATYRVRVVYVTLEYQPRKPIFSLYASVMTEPDLGAIDVRCQDVVVATLEVVS